MNETRTYIDRDSFLLKEEDERLLLVDEYQILGPEDLKSAVHPEDRRTAASFVAGRAGEVVTAADKFCKQWPDGPQVEEAQPFPIPLTDVLVQSILLEWEKLENKCEYANLPSEWLSHMIRTQVVKWIKGCDKFAPAQPDPRVALLTEALERMCSAIHKTAIRYEWLETLMNEISQARCLLDAGGTSK